MQNSAQPGDSENSSAADPEGEPQRLLSAEDEQHCFNVNVQHRTTAQTRPPGARVLNPDLEDHTSDPAEETLKQTTDDDSPSRRIPSIPLTTHVSLHSIGSRFLRQMDCEPLCSVDLPIASRSSNVPRNRGQLDHYTLIGTVYGLYLLSEAGMPPTLRVLENGFAVPLFSGIAIHQLTIFDNPASLCAQSKDSEDEEEQSARDAHCDGLLLATIGPASSNAHTSEDRRLRMWPLSAIINLVKYRLAHRDMIMPQLSIEGLVMPSPLYQQTLNHTVASNAPASQSKRRSAILTKMLPSHTKGKAKEQAEGEAVDGFVLVDCERSLTESYIVCA